jgi:hypothetical protein
MAGWHAEGRNWQLALSLIVAWRETDRAAGRDAFAHRLAEVRAGNGAVAVEDAVLGLTALGNMFVELYAESAGRPVDAILQDAANLELNNGLQG